MGIEGMGGGIKKIDRFFSEMLESTNQTTTMNANNKNNRMNANAARANANAKPVCNACVKAGKPSDHFTRDRSGKVICPTILSTQCRYCKEMGHWADIKFCPALQQKEKNDRLREERKRQQQQAPAPAPKKPTNVFSVLMEEEVAEEAQVAKMLDEFPPLGGVVQHKAKEHSGPSFASMAAKLAECVEPIFQPLVREVVIEGPRIKDLVGEKQRFHYEPSVHSDDEEEEDWEEESRGDELVLDIDESVYDRPLFDEYGQQIFSGRDAWD